MAPKKDGIAPETSITGYDTKETRLLAAAFVSSIGLDKYDYALMAKLTGFTEGTSKKFWPAVKKKVMEQHPDLAKYLAGSSATTAAPTTKNTSKKRKRSHDPEADADAELDPKAPSSDNGETVKGKSTKAPAKGKRGKKVKAEDAQVENSADGGDEMGEFVYRKDVVDWLDRIDNLADEEV